MKRFLPIFCALLMSLLGLQAAESPSEIQSAEELRQWLVGTTWQNPKNDNIRIFERDVMTMRGGRRPFPYKAVDARTVEVEGNRTITFVFDDDYRAYTSSYQKQRFEFLKRRSAAAPEPGSGAKATPARKRIPGGYYPTGEEDLDTWVPFLVASFVAVALFGGVGCIQLFTQPANRLAGSSNIALHDDRIEIRSGVGAISWFFSVVGICGAFMLTLVIQNNAVLRADGPGTFFFIGGCLMGPLCLLMGVFVAGIYDYTIVSKSAGKVSQTQRWFGLRRRFTEFPLTDLKHMKISKRVTKSSGSRESRRSHKTITYPLSLIHRKGVLLLEQENHDHSAVRKQAGLLATFLGLPIHDEAKGDASPLDEDLLVMSMRAKLRASNKSVLPPQPPPGCRIETSLSGDEVTLTLPAIQAPQFQFPWIAIAIAGLVGYAGYAADDIVDRALLWMLAGFVVLIASIVFFRAKVKFVTIAGDSVIMRVNPRELEVTKESQGRRESKLLSSDEIEELGINTGESRTPDQMEAEIAEHAGQDVNPDWIQKKMVKYRERFEKEIAFRFAHKNALYARCSAGDKLKFGRGLRPEEVYWLRDFLKYILSR